MESSGFEENTTNNQMELRAGGTVIASDSETIDPVTGSFSDAIATSGSTPLDPNLVGQPLSIYLTIAVDDVDRSTHFDNVRLVRRSLLTGDGDDDGDVDQTDFVLFTDCMQGPENAPQPTPPTSVDDCTTTHDGDSDADIDLHDFLGLQRTFTGSL